MSAAFAYTQHDGISEIVLDDGKVNAMSASFFDELNAVLDRAASDGSAAVVIAGRAGYFSAGLNIKLLPTLPPDELKQTLLTFGRTMLRVWTFELPTVAAVTGHAVAGGAVLACACDRRYVADGAFRIQMNETAIGLNLPTFAAVICKSAIPVQHRSQVLLHARPYSPAEAFAAGMIDDVVTANEVRARAREAAAALTGLDRTAYATTKRRMRSRAVAWAEENLEAEMVGLPVRAGG